MFFHYYVHQKRNASYFLLMKHLTIIIKMESYRKDKKKPTQKEIYQKYHSDIKDKGAEARASELLGIFLADLRQYLKEKNL